MPQHGIDCHVAWRKDAASLTQQPAPASVRVPTDACAAMVTRTLCFGDADSMKVHARLAAAVDSTPPMPSCSCVSLARYPRCSRLQRYVRFAGASTVSLAIRTTDRRIDDESDLTAAR
jgi:hypothetical protein